MSSVGMHQSEFRGRVLGSGGLVTESCMTLAIHGLYPTRLLCSWHFPGKKTGVGCHFLLQGIFLIQGLIPSLLYCRWILYWPSHQGSLSRVHNPGQSQDTESSSLPHPSDTPGMEAPAVGPEEWNSGLFFRVSTQGTGSSTLSCWSWNWKKKKKKLKMALILPPGKVETKVRWEKSRLQPALSPEVSPAWNLTTNSFSHWS